MTCFTTVRGPLQGGQARHRRSWPLPSQHLSTLLPGPGCTEFREYASPNHALEKVRAIRKFCPGCIPRWYAVDLGFLDCRLGMWKDSFSIWQRLGAAVFAMLQCSLCFTLLRLYASTHLMLIFSATVLRGLTETDN